MIKFVKMSDEEFNIYMEKSIANYANQLITSGVCKKEDSLKMSQEAFNRFLPDGLHTKGHNVMNILDDIEKIGYIWYGPKGNSNNEEAFIYDFLIYEDFRGEGYGKESLELVEKEAKKNNFNKISLHVFGHNKTAVGLYEKMGYEPFSINMSKDIK